MDQFSVNARLRGLQAAEAAALCRGDSQAAKRVKHLAVQTTVEP